MSGVHWTQAVAWVIIAPFLIWGMVWFRCTNWRSVIRDFLDVVIPGLMLIVAFSTVYAAFGGFAP